MHRLPRILLGKPRDSTYLKKCTFCISHCQDEIPIRTQSNHRTCGAKYLAHSSRCVIIIWQVSSTHYSSSHKCFHSSDPHGSCKPHSCGTTVYHPCNAHAQSCSGNSMDSSTTCFQQHRSPTMRIHPTYGCPFDLCACILLQSTLIIINTQTAVTFSWWCPIEQMQCNPTIHR